MKKSKLMWTLVVVLFCQASCTHSKQASTTIPRQTVVVNGEKDHVINNAKKNYGQGASLSEPCVSCLLAIVQQTTDYKKMISGVPAKNIIYNVNWITSTTPVKIDSGRQIINGMSINIQRKGNKQSKNLATYLYNNENARFYLLNSQKTYDEAIKLDSAKLKSIRNTCFWGVASAK